MYSTIIHKHLSNRTREAILVIDLEHNVPVYVVDMCKDLLSVIQEDRTDIELEDVIKIESSCCGHTDYFDKLVLRCNELAKKE